MRNKVFGLFITQFLLINFVIGQTEPYAHYTENDGLPSNMVYHIYSDSRGYIWFGTDNGASRFDGRRFENYSVAEGLTNNEVFLIDEDESNQVWFGTFSMRLSYFHRDSVYQYEFNDLIDQQFSGKSVKTAFHFNNTHVTIGDNMNGLIRISKDGTIERFGGKKRSVFDFEGKLLTCAKRSPDKIAIGINVMSYFKDTNHLNTYSREFDRGMLYKMTPQHYVCRINEDSLAFIQGAYKGILTRDTFYGKANDQIFDCVFRDNNGKWWYGTRDHGVEIYHHPKDDIPFLRILDGSTITHVTRDYQGGFWISSLNNGVFYYPSTPYKREISENLPQEEISKLARGPDSSIFVAYKTGEVWQRKHRNAVKIIDFDSDKFEEQVCLFYDEINNVLHSKFDINLAANDNYEIEEIPLFNRVKPASQTYLYHLDSKGLEYDFRGRGIYRKENGVMTKKYGDELEYKNVSEVTEIRDTLWMASREGLYFIYDDQIYLNEKSGYGNVKINSIDSWNGELAMTIENIGLLVKYGTRQTLIDKSYGLNSLQFKKVRYLENGNIVLATKEGIYLLEFSEEKWNLELLDSPAIGLTRGINDVLVDGNFIYVGGERGLQRISVDDFSISSKPPKFYSKISSINGKHIHEMDEYQLKYDQNDIEVSLIGLDYVKKSPLKYAWRLKGKDKDWNYTSTPNLFFNALDPGQYQFQAKTSILPGEWSDISTLQINITPPFWLTWWFISIEFLAFVTALIGGLFWRSSVINRRAQKEIELNKEKSSLEIRALRAQMNPHFIFNTLTSIQYLINSGQNKKAEYYLEVFSRLLRLIVDQSSSSSVLLLDEIESLRLYLDLEKLRYDDKFDVTFKLDKDLDIDKIEIPGMIIQPFLENAIEHGLSGLDKKGRLELSLDLEGEYIMVKVKDNGVGRKEAQMRKEKFGRTHNSVGIKNVQKRIQLLSDEPNNKSLEFEDLISPEGQSIGTEVRMKIKYSKT